MKPKFIKLRNFKSIGGAAQTIELAPITLLFGPNSAGKSTVLQALIYLREILVHRNYDPDRTTLGGDWLDLGGFRNLIHKRDLAEAIELTIGFALQEDELHDYLSDHEREELEAAGFALPESWLGQIGEVSVSLSLRWSDARSRPFVETIECQIDGRCLARIVSTADGRQVFLEQLDTSHPAFSGNVLSEEDDAPTTFSERFAAAISPSVTTQSTDVLDTLLSEERPFANKPLTELEDLCDGAAKGQPRLLEVLAKEVSRRSSRQAAELGRRISAAIGVAGDQQPLGYLGITNQTDALPDLRLGLHLDKSIWLDDTDLDEEDGPRFRLLSESLLSGFVVGPLQILRAWLEDFSYIGPVRDLPARNLQPQRTPDKSRWANGLAAWEFMHQTSDQQLAEINYWLGHECLKTGYQVMVHRFRELPVDSPLLAYLDREMELDDQMTMKEIVEKLPIRTRVALREEDTGLEVMPQDIGVGISQLFPVVVLTITQSSGLIAIEQPELHVHPAIQVELADLFARYAIEHNKLMLLETHSEHIMLRLLRRIREEPDHDDDAQAQRLSKEAVSVAYVQSSTEGTRFKRLRIDDTGDFLDEWPQGFFDERDQELFF